MKYIKKSKRMNKSNSMKKRKSMKKSNSMKKSKSQKKTTRNKRKLRMGGLNLNVPGLNLNVQEPPSPEVVRAGARLMQAVAQADDNPQEKRTHLKNLFRHYIEHPNLMINRGRKNYMIEEGMRYRVGEDNINDAQLQNLITELLGSPENPRFVYNPQGV